MAGITDTIDVRLPGRVGFPILPVFPAETLIYSGDQSKDFDDVKHQVRTILDSLQVETRGMDLVWRKSCAVPVAERQLTLVIVSEYTPALQQQWVDAVTKIHQTLHELRLHWPVELIDPKVLSEKVKTLPVLSTDLDLIEGWKRARSDFLSKIQDHDWVSVDVMHRGYSANDMCSTVIISARDANDSAWWDRTLPALHHVLQHHHLTTKVELLLSKGLVRTTTPDDKVEKAGTEAHRDVQQGFYGRLISMGTSCSASGIRPTGTLGGWVCLNNPTPLRLGLTNFHVLKEGFGQRDFSQSFPPVQDARYGQVVSPSEKDHEKQKSYLTGAIESEQNHLKRLQGNLQKMTREDPKHEKMIGWAEDTERKLNELHTRLDLITRHHRLLGDVYSASGIRCRDNQRYLDRPGQLGQHIDWALDWCLFRTDEDAIFKGIERLGIREQDSDYAYIFAQDPQEDVTQYCTISPDRNFQVAKRGRTSGWTRGVISAISSDVSACSVLPDDYSTPSNQRMTMRMGYGNRPVSVHAIVATQGGLFIESGDSGSLILLNEVPANDSIQGQVILGLGFSSNDRTLASYMMPFDLVAKDIEDVTGGTVTEPHLAGHLN